ncbi:NFX1-type zinc finger-containing protein 1-like [Ornithodoros turicata]|uniref:NFX1-type zinc finger-containing protein 1-like n=1 Tax=Ornithodoros turicata TaxID=34597 RepID=UPI00313904A0
MKCARKIQKTGTTTESWVDKLQALLQQPEDLALESLLGHEFHFGDFLESSGHDHDATRVAVRLLANVCTSPTVAPQALELASAVAFSDSFMIMGLTALLAHHTCNIRETPSSDVVDVLRNLVQLLQHLHSCLPATTSDRLVILVPSIMKLWTTLQEVSDPPEDVGVGLSKLEEAKNMFLAESHARTMVAQERAHVSQPQGDFRDTPIVPTASELLSAGKPFLRPNLVRGAYRDLDHYLDVQYRLLREDFVRPLREGLQKFLETGMRCTRIENMNVYKDAHVGEARVTAAAIIHPVYFDPARFRKVAWERTKRFMNGTLLILSNDGFETVHFATVVHRNPECLKKGTLTVVFDELFVETVACEAYTMLETQAYFEAYKHNLEALKTISSLPFYDYIVKASSTTNAPAYLKDETKFDLSPLCTCSHPENVINVLNEDKWLTLKDLELDPSQLDAVKSSLLKEFSVIQGPPGTGKTYVGLKIVEVLLRNISVWRGKGLPILVVCYTNHALDQFLEHVLKTTKSIARVGGRCSSEPLERYTLTNRRRLFGGRVLRETCRRTQTCLNFLSQRMSDIYAVRCTIQDLEAYMSADVLRSFEQWCYPASYNFSDWLELAALREEFFKGFADRIIEPKEVVEEDNFDMQDISKHCREDDDRLYSADISGALAGIEDEHPDALEQAWCQYGYKLVSNPDAVKDDYYVMNVWCLSFRERWRLYRYWASKAIEDIQMKITMDKAVLKKEKKTASQDSVTDDLDCLEGVFLVGMTTTGAAKHRELVRQLQPTVVIVEEAAEVLEAHIATSLAPATKHLILIGDHKQLRPSNSVYELSVRYKMEVSLFERMIDNGTICHQLQVQHRMRPNFVKLLVPNFYDNLDSSAHVKSFEDIRGIDGNMFFINHTINEDRLDTKSHSNRHEAELVLGLADYLLNQGYDPTEITILTTYKGQMFLMRDLAATKKCKTVYITCVDNFQGEENDIILLSFVRSNPEKKVGFIKIPNRICVSLSRARKGVYCTGNFDIIGESSQVWKNIVKELKCQNAIGNELKLRCPNHPDTATLVRSAKDFLNVPEGGCDRPCKTRLECGHSCGLPCHGYNTEHAGVVCKKKCERKCRNGHTCKRACFEICGLCDVLVSTQIEKCGHTCEIPCHELTRYPRCSLPCDRLLPCGHRCNSMCRDYYCTEWCVVPVRKTCEYGHDQEVPCAMTAYYWCEANCTKVLACGHHCHNECGEPCSDWCIELKEMERECGHKLSLACYQTRLAYYLEAPCKLPCTKKLPCGHTCSLLCHESCGAERCEIQVTATLPCGHQKVVSCHVHTKITSLKDKPDEMMAYVQEMGERLTCRKSVPTSCTSGHRLMAQCHALRDGKAPRNHCYKRCNAKLSCGHNCAASCRTCFDLGNNGHVPCIEICKKRLDCGHQCMKKCCEPHSCDVPCSQRLPCGHTCKGICSQPCTICERPCKTVCGHGRCRKPCGHPCPPCPMPCLWNCGHAKCSALCSEPCTRTSEDIPCPKKLPCGHRCLGFCGEPCPSLCRVCNRAQYWHLTKEREARFVVLMDCGHSVPERMLAEAFTQTKKKHSARCPLCGCRITFNFRYQAAVREYMEDLQKRKKQVYDSAREFHKTLDSTLPEDAFPSRDASSTAHDDDAQATTQQHDRTQATVAQSSVWNSDSEQKYYSGEAFYTSRPGSKIRSSHRNAGMSFEHRTHSARHHFERRPRNLQERFLGRDFRWHPYERWPPRY